MRDVTTVTRNQTTLTQAGEARLYAVLMAVSGLFIGGPMVEVLDFGPGSVRKDK